MKLKTSVEERPLNNVMLLYWVLPALIMSLILIQFAKREYKHTVAELSTNDWLVVFAGSVLYPITIILIAFDKIIPMLVKDRSFKRKHKTNTGE